MSAENKGLIGAGVLSAIAASLCCITPVLALVAGSSGLASTFGWLEPFRPYLLGITVLVLGYAWFQKLRPKQEIECACDEDEEKQSFMQSTNFLLIVTIFSTVMMAFPYYSGAFFPDTQKEVIIVKQENLETRTFDIEGMTCEACNYTVMNAANEVGGVISSEANYETGKATITFDKSKTTEKEVVESINQTHYKVIK
jgi:copper chaperone CopZ